ncbi:MAG: hypothetical protein ABL870_01855 [Sediminibacterium sp.]
MSKAKVRLSAKEQELVVNADWILTKNAIIQKVNAFFGEVCETYQGLVATNLALANDPAFAIAPKISKGDQYEGLPWVMLDYPRVFSVKDVFAVRTFFWWGNQMSITLQLQGKYQQFYSNAIQQYFFLRAGNPHPQYPWFVCINSDDPWQHHFREDNYVPAALFPPAAFAQLPFIKLAKKIPLEEWDDMEFFLQETFKDILLLLGNQTL